VIGTVIRKITALVLPVKILTSVDPIGTMKITMLTSVRITTRTTIGTTTSVDN
jgi:hypothetical protein